MVLVPWGPDLWPLGMTPCPPSNFPRSSLVGWTCWLVSEFPSSRGDKGRVRSCQILVSVQCPVPETVGLRGHFHLGDDDDEDDDEIQSQRPLTKREMAAEGTHDALGVATGDCQLSGNHHGFLEPKGPERSPDPRPLPPPPHTHYSGFLSPAKCLLTPPLIKLLFLEISSCF